MAKRIYNVLLVREDDSVWTVQFGSWDRDDVLVEREAYRDNGVRASALKLVTCDGLQSSIDAIVAKLNEAERRIAAKKFVAPEDRGSGMTTDEFEAHHGRKVEVDDIFAAWRRLPNSKKRGG